MEEKTKKATSGVKAEETSTPKYIRLLRAQEILKEVEDLTEAILIMARSINQYDERRAIVQVCEITQSLSSDAAGIIEDVKWELHKIEVPAA